MLGCSADEEYVAAHREDLNTFTDAAPSLRGYYHVVESINEHDYTKTAVKETWFSGSYELL